MNSPDSFKDILKWKFSEFEELPPENDWEVFKSKLDLKTGRIRLYRTLSVVSTIVIFGIIATFIILQRTESPKKTSEHILKNEVQHDILQKTTVSNPSVKQEYNIPEPIKRNDVKSSAIQTKLSEKEMKQNSDTGIKTLKLIQKDTPLKSTVEKAVEKSNLNSDKTEKTLLKLNSDDRTIDNSNEKNDQETSTEEQPDSFYDSGKVVQPDNSGLTNPISTGENTVPYVVNVITPNGDGINDKLVISNMERFGTCSITLYNTWGEKIYSSSNYQNNWDATFKGKPVAEGTYYYVLETKEGKVYKGAVNVLK